MSRIAVDVVLLPDESMTEETIRVNADLVRRCGSEIVLDARTCLPHVSLAMACIETRTVPQIEETLATVADAHPVGELVVTGVVTSLNARAQSVSVFALARTRAVQALHERIMEAMEPYFSYDADAAMIHGSEPVAESTLTWIRTFREKSAYAAYFPHVTIGYGTVEQVMRFPRRCTASKLAVCHLGNHCTCRQVLTSVRL